MLTNADCTLYISVNGGYQRIIAQGVHWEETQGRNINKTGSTGVNALQVFIPFSVLPLSTMSSAKHTGYIVRGISDFDPQPGQSIKPLMDSHKVYTLTSVEPKDFGSPNMQHWEVFAK